VSISRQPVIFFRPEVGLGRMGKSQIKIGDNGLLTVWLDFFLIKAKGIRLAFYGV